jgi:hypothetical protein
MYQIIWFLKNISKVATIPIKYTNTNYKMQEQSFISPWYRKWDRCKWILKNEIACIWNRNKPTYLQGTIAYIFAEHCLIKRKQVKCLVICRRVTHSRVHENASSSRLVHFFIITTFLGDKLTELCTFLGSQASTRNKPNKT